MDSKGLRIFLVIFLVLIIALISSLFIYLQLSKNSTNLNISEADKNLQSNGYYEISENKSTFRLTTMLTSASSENGKVYGEIETKTDVGVKKTKIVFYDPQLQNELVIEKFLTPTDNESAPIPDFIKGKNNILDAVNKYKNKTIILNFLLTTKIPDVDLARYKNHTECNQQFYANLTKNNKFECFPFTNQITLNEK